MNRDEGSSFAALIGALTERTISEKEFVELESFLASSASARRVYAAQVMLHERMATTLRGAVFEARSRRAIAKGRMDDLTRRAVRRSLQIAAILTALLVLAVSIWNPFPPRPVASLETAPGTVWSVERADPQATEAGRPGKSELMPDDLLVAAEGRVEVQTGRGLRIVLEAPGSLAMGDSKTITLAGGRAFFDVAEGRHGVRVRTPLTEVRDIGTRFGVEHDGEQGDRIAVEAGAVELRPLGELDAVGHPVAAGEAFAVPPGTPWAAHPLPSGGAGEFAGTLQPQPRFLHWSFDRGGEPSGTHPAVGRVATAPARSEPAEGRFGAALDLGAGAVTSDFPGILGDSPRTVALWIKLARDAPLQHIALVVWGTESLDFPIGKWKLTLNRFADDGTVGALRTSWGKGNAIGATDLRDGRWHHVASVYSGGRDAVHYIDGRRDGISGAYRLPVATRATERSSVGLSFGMAAQPAAGKAFPCLIDEVYVFDGALTGAQIRRQMEQNEFTP